MGVTTPTQYDEKGHTVRTLRVLEAYREGNLSLPPGYSLEFDADMILLRSNKNAIVAAFGVAGIFPSEVTKPAWENYTRGRNDQPEGGYGPGLRASSRAAKRRQARYKLGPGGCTDRGRVVGGVPTRR